MPIDFSSVATTDNYSTAFVPKLQESQKGLACWLDPATVSYTGTPYTGAYRINAGNVERFNGTSWVAQGVNGLAQSGGNYGFGTASPTFNLQVKGAGQTTPALTDAGAKGGALYLQDSGSGAGAGGAVLFGASSGNATPYAAIKGGLVNGATHTTGKLSFSTRNAVTDTALVERMWIDAAGNVGIGVSAAGAKLQVGGDVGAVNFRIGTNLTTDAGSVGFTSNGPRIAFNGSGSAGAGNMDFYAAGALQLRVVPVAGTANWSEWRGSASGARVTMTANGSDAIVGVGFAAKGAGDFIWTANGGTQFQVNSAAGATRWVTVTGANGGNPAIGASGGYLGVTAAMRVSGDGNTSNDVASSYALVARGRLCWVDSTQSPNNRQAEFVWDGGSLTGRFIDDAYTAPQNWLMVTGGYAAGISQVSLHAGNSAERLRITSGGVKVGAVAGAAARSLDVAGGAMTSPVNVPYSATPHFDAAAGNFFIFGTLTGNATPAIDNAVEGQFLTIRFRQDAVGGRTVSLGARVIGALNLAPNKTSYLTITLNNTDATWDATWTQVP